MKERKIFHKNDIFQLNISHYSDENASLLWNRSVTLYILIKHCLIVVNSFRVQNILNNIFEMHSLKQWFTIVSANGLLILLHK